MYDDVINLIAIDERGNDVGEHEVFCRRESITRAEHYQAAAVGLHPSVQFRLADWRDYDGQRFVEHEGKRYIVELERLCECPIKMVGVGPARSQNLERA